MPAENDWVLYAPYSDKSLIRNALTFDLANKMGQYASRTRFCELFLNGEYLGVYILLEKIKRDKNRVDISKLNPDEISGDDLTGGYILKIDKTEGAELDGWISPYAPPTAPDNSIFIQYHYPKPSDIVPEQKEYIRNYITAFEDMLASENFSDPLTGYSAWIDVPSFVDFLLINEISRNVDGYRLSSYFYKDKNSDDNKIYMGPVWDFNLAFGNADYYDGSMIAGLFIDYLLPQVDGFHIPFWWLQLMSDPKFAQKTIERWQELRESIFHPDTLEANIDGLVTILDEAQQRNFQRWPILNEYVWPNNFVGGSYAEEINYLKNWIAQRSNWLDSYFADISTGIKNEKEIINNSFKIIGIKPNPFNSLAILEFQLNQPGNIHVDLYDNSGRFLKNIFTGFKRINTHTLKISMNDFSSGLYFVRVRSGSTAISKKLIYLK